MDDVDRLTQLQSCIDQLVTQFYSSLNHVNNAHDFLPISDEPKASDPGVPTTDPAELKKNFDELATDVVLKARQVENLIESLPGVASTEENQLDKLRQLEHELQRVEQERRDAVKEKDKLLDRCDELIQQVAREKVEIDRDAF